ncbi:hypothetical protein TNCV_3000081 [Trichonephila clavipes]|nr:hypothetical protein TNCV_3000081 [Trichonephila clavipes]
MQKCQEDLKNALEKKIDNVEEKINCVKEKIALKVEEKIAAVEKKIEKKVEEEIERIKEQVEEKIKEQVEERIEEPKILQGLRVPANENKTPENRRKLADRQSIRGARVTADEPCESQLLKEMEKLKEEMKTIKAGISNQEKRCFKCWDVVKRDS